MSSIKDENKTLAAADYVVFAMVLAVSAAIGIYHTCTGGKNRTTCKTCFICKGKGKQNVREPFQKYNTYGLLHIDILTCMEISKTPFFFNKKKLTQHRERMHQDRAFFFLNRFIYPEVDIGIHQYSCLPSVEIHRDWLGLHGVRFVVGLSIYSIT